VLPAAFYDRDPLTVARDLLGCVVEHRTSAGAVAVRLTEVESYAGQADPGSHAFRGQTPRNATMFGPPGRVYVYFTYGMHWCMNLVCGPVGHASAVLLRAGEVVAGEALARERRTTARAVRDLARGPARLAVALGVQRAVDGTDATDPDGPFRVLAAEPAAAVGEERVRRGPRVGVRGEGADHPWRLWVDGETSVSTYRPAAPRRRRTRPDTAA
jgi:DNA-3-methyladenine glycosylase